MAQTLKQKLNALPSDRRQKVNARVAELLKVRLRSLRQPAEHGH